MAQFDWFSLIQTWFTRSSKTRTNRPIWFFPFSLSFKKVFDCSASYCHLERRGGLWLLFTLFTMQRVILLLHFRARVCSIHFVYTHAHRPADCHCILSVMFVRWLLVVLVGRLFVCRASDLSLASDFSFLLLFQPKPDHPDIEPHSGRVCVWAVLLTGRWGFPPSLSPSLPFFFDLHQVRTNEQILRVLNLADPASSLSPTALFLMDKKGASFLCVYILKHAQCWVSTAFHICHPTACGTVRDGKFCHEFLKTW